MAKYPWNEHPFMYKKEVDMNKDEFRWELWEKRYEWKCIARINEKGNANVIRDAVQGAMGGSYTYKIEPSPRDSQAPKFKWTAETVAAVDWSEKSVVETLEACAEHWQERMDGCCDTSGEEWWDMAYCPACKKWLTYQSGSLYSACGVCPLAGATGHSGSCCGDNYKRLKNSDAPKKRAGLILDYINKILEQEGEKEKEWRPELGEEVEITGGYSDWTGRRGKVVGIMEDIKKALLFNPEWNTGHDGYGNISIEGIRAIPGYPKSHMGAYFENLRPISEGKK